MSDIPPIEAPVQSASVTPGRAEPLVARSPATLVADQVEISETGQILSTLESQASPRAERIARIREAIQNGTYETPEKIEITVDRLLEVLRGMRQKA